MPGNKRNGPHASTGRRQPPQTTTARVRGALPVGSHVTRPLKWMAAVRDHPGRPSPMQCHVLNCLALRMDWQTGAGFASTGTLATDAAAGNAPSGTRPPGRARPRCSRRPGAVTGSATAGRWGRNGSSGCQTSTGTQVPDEPISTGTEGGLNRHGEASQPARTAPPSRTSSSRTSSSARGRASAEGARAGAPHTPARTRRCAMCRSGDHDHCDEMTVGGIGGCQCPCIDGCCEPCSAGDHGHCDGLAYGVLCGTPCQCLEHGGHEAVDALLREHAETCPVCEYVL